MYDQSMNTGFELADIAFYETKAVSVPLEYINGFAYWLELSPCNYKKIKEMAKKPKITATIPALGRKDSVKRYRDLIDLPKWTALRLSTFGRYVQIRG